MGKDNRIMDRKQFIEKHKTLFWYTPEDKKEDISDALLIETILNYGSLKAVRELVQVLGIRQVAEVFFSIKGRQKGNYPPEIYHYFELVFQEYRNKKTI